MEKKADKRHHHCYNLHFIIVNKIIILYNRFTLVKEKFITFIAAFGHHLKLIASIFTDSLTWLLILSRLCCENITCF